MAALRRHGAAALRTLLLSYAQILLSRSPWIGALLLLGTGVAPRAAACGLLSALSASATAALLELEPEARADGAYGYNALLLGLGAGHAFAGGGALLFVALLVAPAATLMTAALRSLLRPAALPVLSWPFLLLAPLVMGVGARLLPPAPAALELTAPAAAPLAALPGALALLLRGLGALFYIEAPLGALLLLGALLAHSRIAALYAAAATALVHLLCVRLHGAPPPALVLSLGYNAILCAVALGGVWFVPGPSSLLLALFSVLLSSLLGLGLAPVLAPLGLAVSVLPFNLTVLLVLLALRLRARDRRPKAVDFVPGTPEENLSYAQTRRARFGRLYPVRFRLPVRGTWLCTQGEDGERTHKGPWRHGYDLEVRGEGGCLFREDGTQPEHFHAYRLPVLATAAGTVVKVVGHVPDNPIGGVNLTDNFGNHVMLCHGPGLYSVVAHLLPGSPRVALGQWVQAGEQLGLCGNSGRSPQPHVHFHLQATERLGDATIPCAFDDVVVRCVPAGAADGLEGASGAPERLAAAAHPAVGDELRNLGWCAEAAALLGLSPGAEWRLGAEGQAAEEAELLRSEIDLEGRRCLRSPREGAALYFDLSGDLLTSYDVLGGRRSVLHLLFAALPRVPLELLEGGALHLRDHLPARALRPLPLRILSDFVAPFIGGDQVAVDYRLRREGRRLLVEGEGRALGLSLRTRAEVLLGHGPLRVEVTVNGRRRCALRPGAEGETATLTNLDSRAATRLALEAS